MSNSIYHSTVGRFNKREDIYFYIRLMRGVRTQLLGAMNVEVTLYTSQLSLRGVAVSYLADYGGVQQTPSAGVMLENKGGYLVLRLTPAFLSGLDVGVLALDVRYFDNGGTVNVLNKVKTSKLEQ